MRTINHPLAVRIVQELVDRIPAKTRGVYNRMDPTRFEEGKVESLGFIISWRDITWGDSILIEDPTSNWKSILYYDFHDNCICDHGLEPKTLLIIRQLVKDLKSRFPSKREQIEREIRESNRYPSQLGYENVDMPY